MLMPVVVCVCLRVEVWKEKLCKKESQEARVGCMSRVCVSSSVLSAGVSVCVVDACVLPRSLSLCSGQ